MKTTAAAVLALVGAVVANPYPAAVTSSISPKATDPAGCVSTFSSEFEVAVVNVTSTSSKRSTALVVTLTNGTLLDAEGRTGYIASNYQFQFDKPVQAGAIYTSGWSVCANDTLALGDSAIFYQCLSGTFYNLYDESTGSQCNAVYIDVVPISSSAATTSNVATESSDGQVTATDVSSTSVVTQISDGQVQATTGTTSSAAVVTQISDGQIQATTGTTSSTSSKAVVTQISDGQIQATTGSASSTSSVAVVTQISDGQIQATTGTASTTSSKAVVTQISDGQIQAATGYNGTVTSATATTSAVEEQTTNGAAKAGPIFGLAAGVLAAALL